ncbi:MAG: tetratricopeptide repeat protein [Crocinitomicaceae bacterium]|nr:tetratricopeptide repeat protein [Crocinitomicaceae bacterium]
MRTNKITIIAGSLLISAMSFAQKTNVTSAAVEFKQKFQPALMMGKVDDAKEALLNAKKYIDLAMEHPDTKGDAKTLYYKGEIYGGAVQIASATGDTTFLMNNFGKDAMEVSISSLQESYRISNKFRPDIDNSVNMQVSMIGPMASKFYDEGKFKEAGAAFYYMYKITTAKNVYDTTNLYNAAVCLEKGEMVKEAAETYSELAEIGYKRGEGYAYAANMYTKLKDYDKAKEILLKGKAKYGNDKAILLELVRVDMAKGDNQAAEKSLSDAIAADPKNKQLYFIIGTIYTELGENEKAEQALLKALEVDPNYLDAQYNLGAHYVTWATALRDKANTLNQNDFNYDVLLAQSRDLFAKAIAPLEKYIAKQPKDANVLLILFQINQNLGNSDKAKEYKERYDAVK